MSHAVASQPVASQPVGSAQRQNGLRQAGLWQSSPGRLQVVRVVCMLTCLLFAVLGASAFLTRADALARARDDAAQLVRLQSISTNVVQADADVTNAFLTGGLEPKEQLADYSHAVATAAQSIAEAARGNSSDAAGLSAVNDGLTRYTAAVGFARANNRAGFQVGSAYLRQASATLRGELLPGLQRLTNANDARVRQAYSDASAATLQLVIAGLIVVLVLLGGQFWLARRTHRLINVPLFGGSVAVLVALIAGSLALAWSSSWADDVQRHSYAATAALAQARIAAFDAKSFESLTLIARGGSSSEPNYQQRVGEARAQLVKAAAAGADGVPADLLAGWQKVHQQIRAADDGGNWDQAVAQATARTGDTSSNVTFAAFDQTSGAELKHQADAVSDGLNTPRSLVLVIGWLTLLLGLVAAAAAWWGVSMRLEEYR